MDLYIDISKGQPMDKGHLVQRLVPVHGQNGATYMAHRWVDPNTGQPVSNVHPHQKTMAPPSLNHAEARHPDLSEHDAAKRMEKPHTKDIPWDRVHEGTPITESRSLRDEFDGTQRGLDTYNGMKGVDARKVFNNIFKGMTKGAIERVFSDPDGEWTAELNSISMYPDYNDPDYEDDDHLQEPDSTYVNTEIGLTLTHKSGERMGSLTRIVTRKSDGLHVKNDTFELEGEYQGKGIAPKIYGRAEDMWKHLSGGHPIHISLMANISVGVYAWATKGFDFKSKSELTMAKNGFEDWCSKNGLDMYDTLEKCGYNDLDDLNHAWQFACLDDGNTYNLKAKDKSYSKHVKGGGHLGKAFMLGGMECWYGIKHINTGEPHEDLFPMTYGNAKTMGGEH